MYVLALKYQLSLLEKHLNLDSHHILISNTNRAKRIFHGIRRNLHRKQIDNFQNRITILSLRTSISRRIKNSRKFNGEHEQRSSKMFSTQLGSSMLRGVFDVLVAGDVLSYGQGDSDPHKSVLAR